MSSKFLAMKSSTGELGILFRVGAKGKVVVTQTLEAAGRRAANGSGNGEWEANTTCYCIAKGVRILLFTC